MSTWQLIYDHILTFDQDFSLQSFPDSRQISDLTVARPGLLDQTVMYVLNIQSLLLHVRYTWPYTEGVAFFLKRDVYVWRDGCIWLYIIHVSVSGIQLNLESVTVQSVTVQSVTVQSVTAVRVCVRVCVFYFPSFSVTLHHVYCFYICFLVFVPIYTISRANIFYISCLFYQCIHLLLAY